MDVRLERDAVGQQPELAPAQPVLGRKVSSPELAALAGKHLRVTRKDVITMSSGELDQFVVDVRRLAASVLSQDETP